MLKIKIIQLFKKNILLESSSILVQIKVCSEIAFKNTFFNCRKAIKGDPYDPRLYSQLIDIFCQLTPKDGNQIDTIYKKVAPLNAPLTNMQKLNFVKRKFELMQEFGNIRQFREVSTQLKTYKALCATDLKEEAKKRKELESIASLKR